MTDGPVIKSSEKKESSTENWAWMRSFLRVLDDVPELEELKNKVSSSFKEYLGYEECDVHIFENSDKNTLNDLANSSFFDRHLMEEMFIKKKPYVKSPNELCLPLECYERTLGVIYFKGNNVFEPERVSLLWAFSDQLAVRISDLQIPRHVSSNFKEKFRDISNTIFDNLKGFLEASIEKLKLLEEQNQKLAEVNQLRTELINNVSHELRTPLVSILGFSKILQRHEISEDLVHESSEQIQAAGARLSRMIDDLIQLNRVESKGWDLNLEIVDLGEIAQYAFEEFAPFNTKNKFILDLGEGDEVTKFDVEGDRKLLRQILDNLITNAIKYSPEGGEIRCSLRKQDGFIDVAIQDQGIGMLAEEKSRIFERFYRAKNDKSKNIAGLGLGLSICKDAVTALNGTIDCDSSYSEGSRFNVRFHAV